jgi:hypothetical protein
MLGLGMLLLSALVAYHWGIKPEREEKKRRVDLANAQMRQHARNSRQRIV